MIIFDEDILITETMSKLISANSGLDEAKKILKSAEIIELDDVYFEIKNINSRIEELQGNLTEINSYVDEKIREFKNAMSSKYHALKEINPKKILMDTASLLKNKATGAYNGFIHYLDLADRGVYALSKKTGAIISSVNSTPEYLINDMFALLNGMMKRKEV